MCLLIFAHRPNADYPLVLAANRDEFHARPTAPATFWPGETGLLAGRDLEQGGTWMGITRSGRFAAITNFRDPARTERAPRSRGELPLEFLLGETPVDRYLEQLLPRADQYAGFNLLLGEGGSLWYASNAGAARELPPRPLPAGLYGLSNASLDTPWPKVELGKARLRDLLSAGPPSHPGLAGVVGDRQLARPEELQLQGLRGEMDQLLSSQFIAAGPYGTRSCTTLWTTAAGTAHWRERSYDETGRETGQVEESFRFEDQSIGP